MSKRLGLRGLYESLGREKFIAKMGELMEAKDDKPAELKPEDFSLRELYEAVDSTAFPVITGMLIHKKVIDAYNTVKNLIGDQLVTVLPSKKKSETIVGFTAAEGSKEVKELMPYEESGIGEKYVTTETAKKGRLISISEEAIQFDQTNMILSRAQGIGEKIRLEREKTILEGIIDKYNKVYRPSGVATALYTGANLQATNTLVDWTDLDVADAKLGAMVDEQGDALILAGDQILVPRALRNTARRIKNTTEIEDTTQTGKVSKMGNPYSGISLFWSSILDAVSASNWFWAASFKKQFIWQEIWPIQILKQRLEDSDIAFERDIKARFKVRYYGGIAAVDNKYVIKNTA